MKDTMDFVIQASPAGQTVMLICYEADVSRFGFNFLFVATAGILGNIKNLRLRRYERVTDRSCRFAKEF